MCAWEINIKIYLQEVGLEVMISIHLVTQLVIQSHLFLRRTTFEQIKLNFSFM
jgi:hypothetical protein